MGRPRTRVAVTLNITRANRDVGKHARPGPSPARRGRPTRDTQSTIRETMAMWPFGNKKNTDPATATDGDEIGRAHV